MTMNLSQPRTHPLVEPTCRHIDILGLDLHLSTTMQTRPSGCIPKERDAGTTRLRADTDIPENRQVLPGFEHEHAGRHESNCRRSNRPVTCFRQEETPILHVETLLPSGGQIAIRIIIFDIGLYGDFVKGYSTQTPIHQPNFQYGFHFKRNGDSGVFGQPVRLNFLDNDLHTWIIKDIRGPTVPDVNNHLFVPECFHRFQTGRPVGRINTKE